MFLALFNLLQAQQPSGLSWLIWAGAILAFLLGIGLLVYFFIRLRKSDTELTEQEWSLSRRGIIVDAPDVKNDAVIDESPRAAEPYAAAEAREPEASAAAEAGVAEAEAVEASPPAYEGETRALSSDMIEAGTPADALPEPAHARETGLREDVAGPETAPAPPEPPAPRATQLLRASRPMARPSLARLMSRPRLTMTYGTSLSGRPSRAASKPLSPRPRRGSRAARAASPSSRLASSRSVGAASLTSRLASCLWCRAKPKCDRPMLSAKHVLKPSPP
jgi:hypothetical protein